jgi:hypothetical protein
MPFVRIRLHPSFPRLENSMRKSRSDDEREPFRAEGLQIGVVRRLWL